MSWCGIAYHYPIYGDRSLIGWSPIALHFIVDTCISLSLALSLLREPLTSPGGLAYAGSYKNHGCLK